jgi:hypothetical protein
MRLLQEGTLARSKEKRCRTQLFFRGGLLADLLCWNCMIDT